MLPGYEGYDSTLQLRSLQQIGPGILGCQRSAASWMVWGVVNGLGARLGRLPGSLVAEGGHRLGLLSGPYQDLTDEGLRRLNDERRND